MVGVMTIWYPSLNHVVKPLPDGSSRLVVIQVRGEKETLTLINTYMPAAGSRDNEASYTDILDEVNEITLVVCGVGVT